MTTEQLKQTAAAMLDATAGKIIQCRNPNYPDAEWSDLKPHNASWEFTLNEYRPKPEPVSRPWNCPADVPLNCWLRQSHNKGWMGMVVGFYFSGVRIISSELEEIEYKTIGQWQHSTDRKTWHPCTVTDPAR